MNWLFVITDTPRPVTHGTWLRVYHLGRALHAQGERVGVLSYQAAPAEAAAYGAVGVELGLGPATYPPPAGRPGQPGWPYPFDPVFAEQVRRRSAQFDAVILVRASALQYAPYASAAVYLVADFVDDPILPELRKMRRDWHPLRQLRRLKFLAEERRYERALLPAVDLAVCITEQDAACLARRSAGWNVRVVPNGVDADFFAPPSPPAESGPARVTFLGNLAHEPNLDAAWFLVRKIAPRLWRAVPDARVAILGPNPPPALRQWGDQRVEVTGWVEDHRPELWRSTVVLLPMRIGSGLKNKLLEAWAAGRAVVATPLAGQGLGAEPGRHFVLGRTPDELAARTVELLGDPARRAALGSAGRDLVRARFHWGHAVGQLCAALVATPPRRRSPAHPAPPPATEPVTSGENRI